ncbi:RagB/SusD family nutrient uptake outer membrane protein [Flavivirga amylovorans]|uniref:RagB/SusD family nutrient uptake outer membrane protein n=1 Tax=Flavivirga amylovorans TaxID=870486 RepID=A0ABT8WX22_9FLAO|nr:RagB/SusD family nutrient uptake outer membrane protein [Flavivirga amylovorans]MDO5986234.1 RagB/SusD family nutrient uptake outer membrane protein [Flavivirga amylovorans]
MKKHIILLLVMISIVGVSCSGEFDEVVPSADRPADQVFNDIGLARSFLSPAYSGVVRTPQLILEYNTSNAVSIDGAQRTAVSGPTAESSPVNGRWGAAITNIFRINEFFERALGIQFDALNEDFGNALKNRLIGEAFGLRAYYKWVLLKNYAGPSSVDGSMLGIPIIDDLLTTEDVNNVARSSYLESYNSIKKDLDSAYARIDVLRYEGNDDITGVQNTSRISREMIWALRTRLDLFSASPAYGIITWEQAAQTAYEAIGVIDGGALKTLQDYGDFNNTDNPDHLWRRAFSEDSDLERQHYPPSMFGTGEANPSQNLIDAFPDSNGYPINHPNSIYNGLNPYQNRDARFENFVFYNGENDFRNVTIETFNGGSDAVGGVRIRGTRTGYYLKKFLSSNVSLDPDSPGANKDFKVFALFTRAGLYLDFAEAAVEAYGINGSDGSMTFTAKDALAIVRDRNISNDLYLDIADDFLNSYRDLIRNERRIEFAFEGEYFYDIRRWMLPLGELTVPVRGMDIVKETDGSFSYSEKTIEARNFTDRMYYNPLPRTEVLKSNALIQNAGWE